MNYPHHEYHNPSSDEPVSSTQRARLTVQHILGHLEDDDVEGALHLFDRLHPVDQAEVVAAISDNSKSVLLASLDSTTTARVLEHLEPEQAAQALGGPAWAGPRGRPRTGQPRRGGGRHQAAAHREVGGSPGGHGRDGRRCHADSLP